MASAGAQTAQRIYELNGSFSETNGGTAMVSAGGTLGATGYNFAAGQGPSVSNGLSNTGEYSIEMVFRIDDVSGYRSLINFNNRTTDFSIYNLGGSLYLFNYPGGNSGTTDFIAGQSYRVVITRNAATQQTTAYVNGVQKAQITDSNNLYVASAAGGILHFFRDDGGENTPGFLDRVRIYHSVLTASQVLALGDANGNVAAPEINLTGNGVSILDGELVPTTNQHTRFGSVSTSLARTFTIQNSGGGALSISSIVVSGENASEFAISGVPTSVAGGGNATFNVTYTPGSGVSTSRATITVNNSDSNEAAYDFVVEGEKSFPAVGTNWVSRSAAQASAWYSVTYGAGQFVAVANSGTNQVMTSPDGFNWTARNAAAASGWYSVTHGKGLYVAVAQTASAGSLYVMTSPDGITWTARTAAAASRWRSVVYGNGQFVAVSETASTSVMTSPDGITWTARTSAQNNNWLSVTYGNGLFVAVANSGSNRVMTSPDGVTWTARTIDGSNWRAVTYGNGRFVAVADSGANRSATSVDGINWTSSASPPANGWVAVTYGNGLFVATSESGSPRIMTSADGSTWTTRTAPEANIWYSVTYGNGRFIGTSMDGTNRVMSSSSVTNAAPAVAVNAPASVSTAEGTAPTKTGTFSDADGNASVTLTASQGTIIQNNAAGTWSWTGVVADGPASSTVTITATDSASAVTTTTFTSAITNVAPTVAITAPASGNEDSSLSFTFTATDASTADQTAGFAWSINYGDGSPVQNVAAGNASPLARSYTYPNPGTFTITVTATDKDSGLSTAATRSITIHAVTSNPEIQLRGNGNPIADGSLIVSPTNHTRFGSVATSLVRSFTIENAGPGVLGISSITVAGENAAEFVISAAPTSVAAGASASFNVTFTPSSGVATSRATITVNNNDPDEAAYDFVVEGEKTFPIAGPEWTIFNGFSAMNTWGSIAYGAGKFVAVASFGYPKVMHSPDGLAWTSVNLSPDNVWMSVAYGNGRFVAVSQTGTSRVMTSPDGVTWTARTAAENQGWISVTYGNGRFVAVANSGPNNVMTSPDGVTWTARTTGLSNGIGSVAYGNGLFVATLQGLTNFFLTSPDGITWTQRSAINNQWASVCYGNGRFVAVSISGSFQAATSPDGITWTPQTVPEAKWWWSVCYGNGVFMAIAYEGNVMSSPDGVTWTPQIAIPGTGYQGMGYGAGRFVVPFGGKVALLKPTSPEINLRGNSTDIADGHTAPSVTSHTGFGRVANSLVRTFTIENSGDGALAISSINITGESASEFAISNAPATVPALGSATFDVTYTPTAGVANSRATIIINNNDANEAVYDFVVDGEMAFPAIGDTWVARTAATNNQWQSVTYGKGLFVAVSNDGAQRVMTSPDGITWTSRAVSDGSWTSVTFGKGLFVAVANLGTGFNQVMTSPDGITWTFRASPSSQWMSVTYGNGLFVAVAASGESQVMTSPDGITWTSRSASSGGFWASVSYGNGVFVAVNYTLTSAMFSYDGTFWSNSTTNSGNAWRGMTFGNGRFVKVGGNKVSTSLEGSTWFTQSPIPNGGWVGITYGNGVYAAVAESGTNRVMSSPNGNSWAARTAAANAWSSVAYGNGRFVAVATTGTNRVMTSSPTSVAAATFWAANQGLSGADALPTATPFGDGVPNLLKYAFNMPLDGPRNNTFNPAGGPGANGLPVFTVNPTGPNPTLTAQFLRRRNSGLVYVPQLGTSPNSFSPMNGPQVVTPIDDDWELVTVEEPLGIPVPTTAFSRVSVSAP